jgi:hypothetical protein
MRTERNSATLGVQTRDLSATLDVLARDLIPNTAPENSADPTIFQFLNYGNT